MRRALRLLLPVVAALALTSCASSKPTHFYVLIPAPAAALSTISPPFPIQVAAFHIPPVLDRPEIVRRDGANGLAVNDRARWGASLGEMARNVLAEDLRRRLPPGSVILPDAPAPPSAVHLVVDATQFDQLANNQVKLNGSWALMRGNAATPLVTHDIALDAEAKSSDPAAQAAAMSRLLGDLANLISSDLTQLSAG